MSIGGEGGEAGQYGRGGRGGRSAINRLGLPDLILPDGRRLSEFGQGGYGGAPPIQHKGHTYILGELVKKIPDNIVEDVDSLKPSTTQEWWDRLVERWPEVSKDALARSDPIRRG
ncbi:MAG: hypothetical protein K0U74_09270 [Alphaproteobacteria bacterium]|nr:hypothetical protein [Alphaproteobacteria bacterium]